MFRVMPCRPQGAVVGILAELEYDVAAQVFSEMEYESAAAIFVETTYLAHRDPKNLPWYFVAFHFVSYFLVARMIARFIILKTHEFCDG